MPTNSEKEKKLSDESNKCGIGTKCMASCKCICKIILIVALIYAFCHLYNQHKKLEDLVMIQQKYITDLSAKGHNVGKKKSFYNYFDDMFDVNRSNFKFPFFDFHSNNDHHNSESYYRHLSSVSDDEGYVIKIAVPGLNKEDLNIELYNKVITIKIVDAKDLDNQHAKNFHQSIKVPGDVDQESITTNLNNGLLVITMPKTHDASSKEKRSLTIK